MKPEELVEATAEFGVALRCLLEPLTLAASALEDAIWTAYRDGGKVHEGLGVAWSGVSILEGELRAAQKTLRLYGEDPGEAFPPREREHEVTPEQALRLVYEILAKVQR